MSEPGPSEPAASLMTLKNWLQQEIPVLGVSTFAGTLSGSIAPRLALYLTPWVELSNSVRVYLEECNDTIRRLHPLLSSEAVIDLLTLSTTNERRASGAFEFLLSSVNGALGRIFSIAPEEPVTIPLEYDVPADEVVAMMASHSRQLADFVVRENGKDVLVIELKRPAVFRRTDSSDIPILWDLGDRVVRVGTAETEVGDLVRLDAIHQLYGYMVGLDVVYGILTSFDLLYVVRRGGDYGDLLSISDGIPRSDPHYLATIAYMLHQSRRDLVVFKKPVRKVAPATAPGSSTIPGSRDSKTGKRKAEVGTDQSIWTRTRSHGPPVTLSETPAELLHLARCHFATGWSGKIVRGTYEGQRVIVKLAPVGSARGEALLTEIEAYHMLKEVWGKYVPQLVSYGTTVRGSIVYIATEEIMGYEIGMGPLSQAMAEEIFDALAAVHQCGVLHGDIRPSNILVTNGERAGVRFLDFGFARFVTSDVGRKRECAQLESLLSAFLVVT